MAGPNREDLSAVDPEPASARTSAADWAKADRVLNLLDGKWARVVLRCLSAETPGERPYKLLEKINDPEERTDDRGTLRLKVLLECLQHMIAQGLVERTEDEAETRGTGAVHATFYRLTEDGRDALAILRRVAGVTSRPESRQGVSEDELPDIVFGKPSIARVYDFWLDGKDNLAVDREMAGQLLDIVPLNVLAKENREFLARAVSYVSGQGITQFLDIGAGLPTSPSTHEIARKHNPAARVAYVDNDPMAIVHARALLASEGVAAAIAGDMTDPGSILADPALTSLIDLGQPACVILAMVLHFVDHEQATRIISGFADALAPGSYLILSIGIGDDPRIQDRLEDAYTAGKLYRHSPGQVRSYFAGFELIGPGVTDVRYWPDRPDGTAERRAVTGLAGVGRKVR